LEEISSSKEGQSVVTQMEKGSVNIKISNYGQCIVH
jgi:hypothetical protein